MTENIHNRMDRWCSLFNLNWEALTPAQANRAEQLAMTRMDMLPDDLRSPIVRWIVVGQPAGSFLMAVFANDLQATCAVITDKARKALPDIVRWLEAFAPAECWGTPERVTAWSFRAKMIGCAS